MDVLRRTASPFFSGRDQLELDDAFRTEGDRDDAVEILTRRRHEHAGAFAQRCFHFGTMHELADVRRSDFFFPFRDHHQIHRHLLVRAANRVQRREER